jgi:hypothetical protein
MIEAVSFLILSGMIRAGGSIYSLTFIDCAADIVCFSRVLIGGLFPVVFCGKILKIIARCSQDSIIMQ